MTPNQDFLEPGLTLAPRDADALDALITVGYQPERVSPPHRERAEQLSRLFGLLQPAPVATDSSLIDAAYARVLRAAEGHTPSSRHTDSMLVSDDQEALDAWVMAGFQSSRVTGALRERARRHEALAALVTAPIEVGDAPTLIEKTIARIDRSAGEEQTRLLLDAEALPAGGMGRRFRFSDLASIAALLLIGTSVAWPIFATARHNSLKTACHANMGSTALAFSSYAGSFRDALPVASASLGQGSWWQIGTDRDHSNSANLFTLVRSKFGSLSDLACPGNPKAVVASPSPEAWDWQALDQVSYSYQIMFGQQRPVWGGPVRSVVIADRSPIIRGAMRGELIDPFANSQNHTGRGQHVLFNDGGAQWVTTATLKDGDNLWLPRSVERRVEAVTGRRRFDPLKGTETPAAADDAFVGP